MRGSDAIVQLLISHGVKDVFGVPGDTSMNLHDAFWQRQKEINHITCRDERNAVYMADAYARVKNTVGVVEVPSGGGALYAVPGVSEANISSIPLLCLASDIAMSSDGTGALTDVDQEAMFKPLTRWTTRIKLADKIPPILRKAFRMATMGRPGAVHVAIPENIHGAAVEFSAADLQPAAMQKSGPGEPCQDDVDASAVFLQKALKPVILAGGGVHLSSAHAELENFAVRLGIPVATTINGKGSVSEFLPISAGTVGANGGSEETNGLIKQADLVLVLGSRLNNVTTMGKDIFSHRPTIIQVDTAPEMLDANVRNTFSIISDIKSFLLKLDPVLSPEKEQISEKLEPWLNQVQQAMTEKRARISAEINKETERVNPAKIFDLLERLTDADTVFVADAGTATPYLASFFRLKKAGRKTIFPRAHGSLGYALPAAIGAKVANPHATVVSLFGDGSFGMAVGDLETARRVGLPVVFIHFQNNSYGWIKTIQKLYYEEKYFAVDFSTIDAVKIAAGFGITAWRVSSNAELENALKAALAHEEPVFLDVMIEPPTQVIPPVLKWERDQKVPPEKRKKLTF